MLLGPLLLQRRTARKKQRQAILLLSALLMLGLSSRSQADINWDEHLSKSYLILSLYQADGSHSRNDFANGLAADGVNADVSRYDVSRQAYQLVAGYRYHSSFAVELGYLDLGEVDVDFDAIVGDASILSNALKNNYPISGEGWTIANRYNYSLNKNILLSAKAGIFIWDGDVNIRGANINTDLKDETDLLIGFSAYYNFHQDYSLGINFDRIFFDNQDVDLFGGNFVWKF